MCRQARRPQAPGPRPQARGEAPVFPLRISNVINSDTPRKSFLKSPEQLAAQKTERERLEADKLAAAAGPNLPFERHLLVCSGPNCNGLKQGHAIKAKLQELIEKAGLQKRVKLNLVNCFDLCSTAPNCIVYPDGVIYAHVKTEDCEEIFSSHLQANRPVDRLKRVR